MDQLVFSKAWGYDAAKGSFMDARNPDEARTMLAGLVTAVSHSTVLTVEQRAMAYDTIVSAYLWRQQELAIAAG